MGGQNAAGPGGMELPLPMQPQPQAGGPTSPFNIGPLLEADQQSKPPALTGQDPRLPQPLGLMGEMQGGRPMRRPAGESFMGDEAGAGGTPPEIDGTVMARLLKMLGRV